MSVDIIIINYKDSKILSSLIIKYVVEKNASPFINYVNFISVICLLVLAFHDAKIFSSTQNYYLCWGSRSPN